MITKAELDKILNGESSEIDTAFSEIVALQKREIPAIKTGIVDLDHFLITGLNNMMVFCGSRPSMGKTHTASVIKENLLSKEVNPNVEMALLYLNWEMQAKSLVLRHLKRSLKRSMRDILSREFTEDERDEVRNVMEPLRDDRVLNFNEVIQGDAFEYLVEQYIYKNKGKEIIVLIDHLHIILTKTEIDEFLSLCNTLKKRHTNLSFIIFFQLNREIEKRWRGGDDAKTKVNPKNYLPNSGDIYNTDSLFQFGDVIFTNVIPQVVDLDEYTTVNKDRNKHLEPHYIPGASADNITAKLKGRNRVYRNYIKIRLNDNFEDPRIYCEVLDESIEEQVNASYYNSMTKVKQKPSFNDDKKEEIPIVPFSDLSNSSSKGQGFEGTLKKDAPKTDKPF